MKIILRASPVLTLTDTTSVWSASLCVQLVYLRRLCVILVTNTAVNLQTFTDPHQDRNRKFQSQYCSVLVAVWIIHLLFLINNCTTAQC